jgi:hypothetical protein
MHGILLLLYEYRYVGLAVSLINFFQQSHSLSHTIFTLPFQAGVDMLSYYLVSQHLNTKKINIFSLSATYDFTSDIFFPSKVIRFEEVWIYVI